jgi:hypothetical protein
MLSQNNKKGENKTTIVGFRHARKRGDDDPGAPSEDDFASSYEYFIEEIRALDFDTQ